MFKCLGKYIWIVIICFELYITFKIKQKKEINFPVLAVPIESCSVNSCNFGVPVGEGERRVFLLHLLGQSPRGL